MYDIILYPYVHYITMILLQCEASSVTFIETALRFYGTLILVDIDKFLNCFNCFT
jgi:hypothetical protein